MIVLDSDHLSILEHPESPQYEVLTDAMNGSTDDHFVTTVVTLEGQARGWLAAIHRAKQPYDQPLYYTRLAGLVSFFSRWELLPFDEPAADKFVYLRRQKVRIGTSDLKIASIALV